MFKIYYVLTNFMKIKTKQIKTKKDILYKKIY